MDRYLIYILTNIGRSVLYIGVTKRPKRRIQEHRRKSNRHFTGSNHAKYLVYFEELDAKQAAYRRERQLKGWTRKKKEWLIQRKNHDWEDLSHIFLSGDFDARDQNM